MRKKLVVVDDENDIREVLLQALEFTKDWRVLEAADGASGLEMIRRERPDAAVLDVMMPGMDGRQVLKALRSDPATAEIPVVFLTASIQKQDVRELESLAPRAVIAKPFDPLTIADEIAKALGW